MSIKTDSTPVEEPKNPETCNLFQIYRHFAPSDRVQEVKRLYLEGGAGYGTLKKELVGILWDYFKDTRAEKMRLMQDPGFIRDILRKGAEKARSVASVTLQDVRTKVGLNY